MIFLFSDIGWIVAGWLGCALVVLPRHPSTGQPWGMRALLSAIIFGSAAIFPAHGGERDDKVNGEREALAGSELWKELCPLPSDAGRRAARVSLGWQSDFAVIDGTRWGV